MSKTNKKTKYIFVTGGVVSSLGKGISVSSIARILIELGYSVRMQKFDPYLNVDPGTMSPYQHGEVFVTRDGAETDLDQGHYERFSNSNLNKYSSITSGKIYLEVIEKERKGLYNGQTVQVVPHVTNAIKEKINLVADDCDFVISEVGGTIGDIEGLPYIEAIRQFRNEHPVEDTLFIHATPIIQFKMAGEPKTKPTQHSIKELRSLGITPDILLVRSENEISDALKIKLANTTNININNIFTAVDASNIYFVPTNMYEQKIHESILKHFQLQPTTDTFENWIKFNDKIKSSTEELKIAIVGKYVELKDAYFSVIESLKISGYHNNVNVNIKWINSNDVTNENVEDLLNDCKGIVVPGGFGTRGIDGKIAAIKYARVNNVPFLGICLGMQLAAVEFSRNVLGLLDANSTELDPNTTNPIIDIIVGKDQNNIGGTLRLGEYQTKLKKGSLANKLYDADFAFERHRHRFEFNNSYIQDFEKNNMVISGTDVNSNLVEIIEYPQNDFFIGAQYHPELTTKPYNPNPLFVGLIKAAKNK